MGTKRPSCTLFDTTPNINTSDRKLQPGGKISRDPSPRPAMTAQSERERDSKREDEWRRERETEKMRDKARYRDIDPRERYYDRDRGPLPRLREGEREPREREMTREGDRSRNGRPLSNVEAEMEGKPERGMKKGDTFPRMTKISAESFKKKVDEERGYRTQRDQLRRMEKDDWERERERARQREGNRERERDDLRRRAKEEGKTFWGDEKVRHRERYQEVGYQERRRENDFDVSHDRRERDTARKREKQRLNTVGTVEHRRRDREMYCDRKERERTHRRVGGRDTRSEGDSDEREMKRERERGREREELIYQHSKSEGDNTGNTSRGKHRQEYREEDRHRETDRSRRGGEKEREGYRETDRREAREGDRWKEDVRDRREYDRYREYDQRKVRERRERDVTTGRGPQNEVTPRVPPRVQSSGEWSSDMDNETRYTRSRDSYEESGKESTAESERDVEDKRSPDRERRRREQKRSERQERTGNVPEQRRMWLEPQRGKSSKESSLEEEFVDKERHGKWKEKRGEQECSTESEGRRVKEDEKFSEQSSYRHTEGLIHGGRSEYKERETEGVSVDGEDVDEVWRDTCENEDLSGSDEVIEGGWRCDEENVTDNTEESDGEEEGGSDYRVHSESEGGSERQERDRMLSGEDGFVTVSSGGDEEDEREEFVDCQDSWEGGNGPSTGFKGGEGGEEMDEEWKTVNEEDERSDKKPTYVFCVIGQTLPRSKTSGMSPSEVGQTGGTGRDTGTNDVTQQPQDDLHLTRGRNDSVMNQDNEVARDRFKVPLEERLACGEPLKVDIRYRSSDTETGDRQRKAEHPYAEIGPFKRDSQTEKLLMEWREKNNELAEREQHSPLPMNPYGDVCSQVDLDQILPTLDGITLEAMSPEEKEAIRIRMSGAWSMSEEPKRHSQAPHLKWAKNVVREILGNSEEQSLDEPSSEVNHSETVSNNDKVEDVAQETGGGQLYKSRSDDQYSEPELEEEEPLEVEGLRGMEQSQQDMHADQPTAMHGDTPTYTQADTLLYTERKEEPAMDTKTSGDLRLEKAESEGKSVDEAADEVVELSETEMEANREREVEMYLSVSNTLYKPNSCPLLHYESEAQLLIPSREGAGDEGEEGEIEEDEQGEEPEEGGSAEEVDVSSGEGTEVDRGEGADRKIDGGSLTSSCSSGDLGPEVHFKGRWMRKTIKRRNEELVEVEEEEGVGRDRRTRIFSSTEDDEDRSNSWGEVELRNVLDTIGRRKRNSKFFNAAQLYQQYSEAAQNFEILRQARSDIISVCEENTPSPAPSPPPARRPLPPLPPVPHPHSLSHTGSITSVKSLPVPEPPKSEGRPSSPRLSISLTQSSTLWRELPAVRNSTELEELTEDQRRLQEVRFEVLTSEASYCRSLDIVVEHFVKSKQLGALLATQDRNWLFSRLADVRAISHSFLSKLEERLESNIMHFTVCDIIARHCQRFKMVYVPYLTNQSYQDATYQRLMNENQGFKRIVEKLERSPVCQRLPLRSFLVLPFQRITRIKLLVQNIVKRTTPGTTEELQAIKALKLLEKLIQESNDSISQMKSIESLVSLSAKVDFECRTLPLISQSRRLVREGPVTELMDFSLKDTERNIYMHLFNDYLLLSQQKEGGRFTVIDHAPVSELRAENCRVKLHSLQKNLFRLHMAHKSLLLRTDTQSDKLRWISALSRPHPEIDFSSAQDFPQMQCIRAFVAQQPDELSLEKADIILVHQQSSDRWVEGTRLSDRHRGWVPESHLELISNSRVRQRNLSDALKLTTATAAV